MINLDIMLFVVVMVELIDILVITLIDLNDNQGGDHVGN